MLMETRVLAGGCQSAYAEASASRWQSRQVNAVGCRQEESVAIADKRAVRPGINREGNIHFDHA